MYNQTVLYISTLLPSKPEPLPFFSQKISDSVNFDFFPLFCSITAVTANAMVRALETAPQVIGRDTQEELFTFDRKTNGELEHHYFQHQYYLL